MYPGQFKAQEVFEQLLVNLKNADNEVVLMDLKILAKTGQCILSLVQEFSRHEFLTESKFNLTSVEANLILLDMRRIECLNILFYF